MFYQSPSVIPAHTPGTYDTSRAPHLRVSLVVYSASYFAGAAKRGSDDVVAPPVCAHRVVPQRWVGFEQCNPSGAAADAGHAAAAWVRGAARAADDGVVDIPRALSGSPRAPCITAQRGA